MSSPGAPPPTTGVAARANAICARRNRELAAVSGGDGLSPSASTTSRRAAIEQRALTELGALSPPPELAAEWKAVLAYTRSTFAYDAKIAQYARTGDDKGVLRQIEASEEVQLRLLSAAVRAGMRRCDSIG